jgi:transposase-like protein
MDELTSQRCQLTMLDEDALAGLKTTSRERKLSTAERIAIYAFHLKGVPAKLIARTFGVRPNAVYYITNWDHTAAHENVKNAYEQMGADKVWAEIVTPSQTESINEGMHKLLQGKPLNDRRYRRNDRNSPRPRRARAIAELPETANDGEGGGVASD